MRHFFAPLFIISILGTTVYAAVDKNVNIKRVQTHLAQLCLNPGSIDGIWGRNTELAILKFFKDQNKTYDGTLDPIDAELIYAAVKSKTTSDKIDCPSKSNAPIKKAKLPAAKSSYQNLSSNDTKFLQFGLIALGHMNGYVDGKWGNKSSSALANYLATLKNQSSIDDFNAIKQQILKDISRKKSATISSNLRKNLKFKQVNRRALISRIKPNERISIRDLKKNGEHNVYIAINKEISIDANLSFGRNDKVFIIDSLINSQSRFRNEYEIKFSGNALLGVFSSASDSLKNKEAFVFTYTGKASAIHLNYKHSVGDPWQVAKANTGHMEFLASTCNMTLRENSRTRMLCDNADEVMIEPILPKGKYSVTLPSDENVSVWESDPSLPWDVTIKRSYIERIDFGIGPGVSLTVVDTKNYQGGIAMCCSGSGKIEGLRANKIYKNRTWRVTSDQGSAKLTLINSSTGGVWPTAWGSYKYEIVNSDLIDPTLGSSASMKIVDSTFNQIRAMERARVTIINSRLSKPSSKRALVTATDGAKININGLKRLKNEHLYTKGSGKIIVN